MELCHVYGAIQIFLKVYLFLMLVYALISWVPSLRGRWSDVVTRLVEPVLVPVRRIIPPLGGFDLSFLVVILIIQYVNSSIVAQYACPIF
jgi:YggT family protein